MTKKRKIIFRQTLKLKTAELPKWKPHVVLASVLRTRAVVLLIFCALLPGCTLRLIGNALDQGESLTPEQIKAYNEVGSKVFSCLTIKGPPPGGATVIITVPKESVYMPKFGDNCQVMQ